MDAKYLGEIERGWHAPSITTAKRIADALEVPLARLVADI
jgi:DNA-binding XRE family transcriptional regulator